MVQECRNEGLNVRDFSYREFRPSSQSQILFEVKRVKPIANERLTTEISKARVSERIRFIPKLKVVSSTADPGIIHLFTINCDISLVFKL